LADKWTELKPSGDLPQARWGHSANVLGENMYVFGGTPQAGQALNDLWGYNFQYGVWQKLSPAGGLPPARFQHSGVTIGDGVWIYGGNNWGSTNLNDLWVLYPHKNTEDSEETTDSAVTTGLKAALVINIILCAIVAVFAVLVYRHISGGSTSYSSAPITSSATYATLGGK